MSATYYFPPSDTTFADIAAREFRLGNYTEEELSFEEWKERLRREKVEEEA